MEDHPGRFVAFASFVWIGFSSPFYTKIAKDAKVGCSPMRRFRKNAP